VEFEIDMRSQVPSYRQLADRLAAAIATGEFAPDDPIPSLRTLQQETGLAMATVQHAITVLREEGLVYSVSGRGTFVSPKR
jgi:GntR family transcriptional regulator